MTLALTKRLVYGSALSAAQNDQNMTDMESEVNALIALAAALATTSMTSYRQDTTPTGTIPLGAIWTKPGDNNFIQRWNGSSWDDITRVLQAADFGTGISPVYVFDDFASLPALPDAAYPAGTFATLKSPGGAIYRSTGTAWTQDTDATTITGTLVASQIAAGAILASHIGANLVIANTANIADAIITSAKIISLSADKIDVGNMKAVFLEANAKLYDDTYPTRYFTAISAATKTPLLHASPVATWDFNVSAAPYPITAFGFDEHEPLIMYGQGHATSAPTIHVRNPVGPTGWALFSIEARIIGYSGPITVYARISGSATVTPLASWNNGPDDGNSRISSKYVVISGLVETDYVEFYVAPCGATGMISDPALITPIEIIASGIHTWGGGAAPLDAIVPGVVLNSTDIVQANISVQGVGVPTTVKSLVIDNPNDEIDITLDQNGEDGVTKIFYTVLRQKAARILDVYYEIEVQSLNWTSA